MLRRSWRNFDYLLLGTLLVLSAYGVIMIYSATINTLGVENPVQRQILYRIGAGVVLLLVTASLDYPVVRGRPAPIHHAYPHCIGIGQCGLDHHLESTAARIHSRTRINSPLCG